MTRLLSIALVAATLSATDQLNEGSRRYLAAVAWQCGMVKAGLIYVHEGMRPELEAKWKQRNCAALEAAITAGGNK